MKDANGRELTHYQLKRLLKQNVPYQYNWWKPKAGQKFGQGKPPPGVKQTKDISRL